MRSGGSDPRITSNNLGSRGLPTTPNRRRHEGLDRHETGRLRDVFEICDSNGNGTISRRELKAVLLDIGSNGSTKMNARQAEKIVQAVDVNGDGVIDYRRFVDWVSKPGHGADMVRALSPEPADAQDFKMKKKLHSRYDDVHDEPDYAYSDGGSTRMTGSDYSESLWGPESNYSESVSGRSRSSVATRRTHCQPSYRHGRGEIRRPHYGDGEEDNYDYDLEGESPPQYFTGGFSGLDNPLQSLHDASLAGGAGWAAAEERPELSRRAGRKAKPVSVGSRNVVERVGAFEGGRGRGMSRKEADGETLADDTGIIALWRPKKALACQRGTTALGRQREVEFCARVGPDSRCFCGFSFIDHSAAARLGGGAGGGGGFAWKTTLGKQAGTHQPGFSFDEPGGAAEEPCSNFRYMPSTPAQTTQVASCAAAFRAYHGAGEDELYDGWWATCRNCHRGHQEHDPEKETCPVHYTEVVGSGRFESGWECSVCGGRWEDHETVREAEHDYEERGRKQAAQQRRCARRPFGFSDPMTPDGGGFGTDRASEVEALLQENTYGISGKHRGVDHYAPGGAALAHRIQLENARIREIEEEEQFRIRKEPTQVAGIDTRVAYKEGKAAMYGFGVGNERQPGMREDHHLVQTRFQGIDERQRGMRDDHRFVQNRFQGMDERQRGGRHVHFA